MKLRPRGTDTFVKNYAEKGGVLDLTSSLTITKPIDAVADFGSSVGDYPSGFPYAGKPEKVPLELK